MNPFEMVIGIVLIVSIGSIVRAKLGVRQRYHADGGYEVDTSGNAAEARRLNEEVRALKERIQVLERVITDNHSSSSLDREIEKLRDERR